MPSILYVLAISSTLIFSRQHAMSSLQIRGNGFARIGFVAGLCPRGTAHKLPSDINTYDVSDSAMKSHNLNHPI